jgi:putative membrane protein
MLFKNKTKDVYDFENKEEIILRDFLALERTRLANERTYFAYIRTSLYLILAGIAFLEFDSFHSIVEIAYLLFFLSFLLFTFGSVRYFRLNKKIKRFYSKEKPSSEG